MGLKVQELVYLQKNLAFPEGLLISGEDIYISNTGKHQILKLTNNGTELFAGSSGGFIDGDLTQAKFRSPTCLTEAGGAIYVSDRDNHCVRQILDGQVSSLSLGGARGY